MANTLKIVWALNVAIWIIWLKLYVKIPYIQLTSKTTWISWEFGFTVYGV
jgi:hypothetical protein